MDSIDNDNDNDNDSYNLSFENITRITSAGTESNLGDDDRHLADRRLPPHSRNNRLHQTEDQRFHPELPRFSVEAGF